jgi:hypothetical protein
VTAQGKSRRARARARGPAGRAVDAPGRVAGPADPSGPPAAASPGGRDRPDVPAGWQTRVPLLSRRPGVPSKTSPGRMSQPGGLGPSAEADRQAFACQSRRGRSRAVGGGLRPRRPVVARRGARRRDVATGVAPAVCHRGRAGELADRSGGYPAGGPGSRCCVRTGGVILVREVVETRSVSHRQGDGQ